jgi:hypothetical protein
MHIQMCMNMIPVSVVSRKKCGLIKNVEPLASALGAAQINMVDTALVCHKPSQIRLDNAEGRDIVRKSCHAIRRGGGGDSNNGCGTDRRGIP